MKITKLLKYDIIHGFYSNKDKAGIIILVAAFCRLSHFRVEWLLVNLCILYATLNYVFSDFDVMGIQFLSRAGKRKIWWNSKCVWQICFITIAHSIVYIVNYVMSFWIPNEQSYFFAPNILKSFLISEEQAKNNTWSVTWSMFMVVLLFSIFFNILQSTLTMVIMQRYAFLTACILLVFTEIFSVGWIGNDKWNQYLGMLQQYGMGTYREIVIIGIISIVCIVIAVIGCKIFKKYDIWNGNQTQ